MAVEADAVPEASRGLASDFGGFLAVRGGPDSERAAGREADRCGGRRENERL
jgi:hypothetical protein